MKVKQGKQEKGRTRRWVSVRRRGDPGEIQGRSIDLWGSVFRSVGGSMGEWNEGRCWHRGQGVGIRTRERIGRELGDVEGQGR